MSFDQFFYIIYNINVFIIIKGPSLSLKILFSLKDTLLVVNIATIAFV